MQPPETGRGGTEVFEIDLKPLKEGSVLERNITLRNGDVFYVPRRKIEVVYVIGDVMTPGAFELPEDKSLTASKAISWAGGPSKTAKMKSGILMRYEADGTRRELPVDFAAVLKGAQPDVEVRPDDVIFSADLPKTRSGKIMRRLLRDIAEGKALGDTTTLADPAVVARLKEQYQDEH